MNLIKKRAHLSALSYSKENHEVPPAIAECNI